MALSTFEQFKAALERSQSVVVAFPYHPHSVMDNLDNAATAMACGALLTRMGKKNVIVSPEFNQHPSFSIISDARRIQPALPPLNRILVSVPTQSQDAPSISQEVRHGEVMISITPATGILKPENIRVRRSTYDADLIITVGAPDLKSLGSLFSDHSDFFYGTPIMNIDCQSANEAFGAINLLDLSAAANSQSMFTLLERWTPIVLDATLATTLLAGLVGATRSFKSARVNPHTLEVASRMVGRGADRERIMNHLFRSRSLATVKLWGRALTHIRHHPEVRLVTTTLALHDFHDTAGNEEELPDVIEELIFASPEADVALLLYESRERTLCGILFSKKIPAAELMAGLGESTSISPSSTRFCIRGMGLTQAEDMVIQKLTARLRH